MVLLDKCKNIFLKTKKFGVQNHIFFCDIYIIMGIKIVLTESQVAALEKRVGKALIAEANLSCTDLSYGGLRRFLDGREERKLGHNTWVEKVSDYGSNEVSYAVKYHRTNILTINSEDIVKLNTGGWETVTTKDRLNQFLRCRNIYISQKKHVWYISTRYGTYEYKDGMLVLPDGQVQIPGEVDPNKIQTYLDRAKSLNIDPKYNELYGISDN